MKIGLAKEKAKGEVRVALLPEEVKALIQTGLEVFVEKNAAEGIFISDEEYRKAGAQIEEDPLQIYNKDIVVKLKAPLPQEFEMLKIKNNIVVSMFHFPQNPWNLDLLKAANSTVVALDLIKNKAGERLVNCNRMTGEQAMLMALDHAPKTPQDCKILMLGYGEVALGVLKVALSLGAYVKVLRRAEHEHIKHFMEGKDILVNAIKWPKEKREKKEYLVTRDMLSLLSPGAIILDIAVDYPGPIETCRSTTIADPIYIEEGHKHICIYGYPALSPISSSQRYSKQILPIVLEIAEKGLKKVSDPIKGAIIKP